MSTVKANASSPKDARFIVNPNDFGRIVILDVLVDESSAALLAVNLTPKRARKLARALNRAAQRIEDLSGGAS